MSTPMSEYGVTAAHLPLMEQITVASGKAPDKAVWTELGIYYRSGFNRPFVSVVEGKVGDNAPTGFVPRFKHATFGTLERALSWFESSQLTDQLALGIPVDADTRYLSKTDADMQNAAVKRAIREAIDDGVVSGARQAVDRATAPIWGDRIPVMAPGDRLAFVREPLTTLHQTLSWLYPDATSNSALAAAAEQDFGMPARTTRRALQIEGGAAGEQGPWVAMFIAAMQHFDRPSWLFAKEEAARNNAGAGASDMATIASDKG